MCEDVWCEDVWMWRCVNVEPKIASSIDWWEEKQKEVGNRPKNTGWISVDRITKDTLSTYNTWIQIGRLQKIYHPHWAKWLLGKLFSIGCCICHHFEEHQTIHHRHTLHAMPLAQAVTTVVAQPRANACRLRCVEHFYSTTRFLTDVMAHMLHIALFKDLCQYVILDQIGLFAL